MSGTPVEGYAWLYKLHLQNKMGEAQGRNKMSNEQTMWLQGIMEGTESKMTGSGNPKTVLLLKVKPEDNYPAKINFSGSELEQVPANINDYRGYALQASYTNFALPSYPGKFSKQGVTLILCNEKGELPPLPANPEPQEAPAPTQAPFTPNMETYIPPATTATSPPPLTTTVPPDKRPQLAVDESTRVESMVRQSCFKGAYSALHATNLSDTQIRHKLEYWTDWAMLKTQRVTGSQHRMLEAKIAEIVGSDNRKLFCEFLVEEANCKEMVDSGSIHLTDMSSEHAEKICGEWWENMISVWPLWKQEKDKETDPNIAPPPQSQGPVLTDPAKPSGEDVPEFMKQ